MKSQAANHGDFMYAVICQYSHHYNVTSLQCMIQEHFMSEQIDLHVFNAITAASCVDIYC